MLEGATEGGGAVAGAQQGEMAFGILASAQELGGEERKELKWSAIAGAAGFGAGISCSARPTLQKGLTSYIHISATHLPSQVNGCRDLIGRE